MRVLTHSRRRRGTLTGPSPSSPAEARTSAWHALRNSLLSLRRIHRDATTSQTRRPSDRGNFIFSSPLIPHSSAPMSHQCSSMFPSQIRRLHVLHVRRQAPSSSGRNIWNTQTRVSSVRSANDGASSVADRDRVATMARVGSAVQGRGNIPNCGRYFAVGRIDQRAAVWNIPNPPRETERGPGHERDAFPDATKGARAHRHPRRPHTPRSTGRERRRGTARGASVGGSRDQI